MHRGAIIFEGAARLAICRCPDPPLALAARGGRFEPPGDLFLRSPRVEVGGVPVFALPYLWLRTPSELGALPPILALRGADGWLLGSGVHVPWRGEDRALRALDVTAAFYTGGGVALGASLTTPDTTTRAQVDLVHGRRAALDARGALTAGRTSLAWDLDAVRGDRARSGAVELGPAAQPFDTGAAEVSLRAGAAGVSVTVAAGAAASAARGEGLVAAGPRVSLALGGPVARVGSWSADASGAVLSAGPSSASPFGRAALGLQIDARPGPLELRASVRARGRVAGDDGAASSGLSSDVAAAARAALSLPFSRAFPGAAGEAPLVHWVRPELSLAGAAAARRGTFFAPVFGEVAPASWIAAGGVSTSLGRHGGPALRFDARAGAAGDQDPTARGLFHARLAFDGPAAAGAVEAAAVGDELGVTAKSRGYALLARARLGFDARPSIRLDAAVQGGGGAAAARAAAAGAWATLPGDARPYLADHALTVGAEVSVPWTLWLRTTARADADLASGALLSVRGLAAYRHPCGCFGAALLVAHREGRSGVDAMLNVDVTPRP